MKDGENIMDARDAAAENNNAQANNRPKRTLLEEWRERQYGAYVNFLRKQDMYEEWKKFKAGKRQDENKLMLEFLTKKEKERH